MNIAKRILIPPIKSLIRTNVMSMAYLALLAKPKKPAELSPVFALPKRLKGHSKNKAISKTQSRKKRGKCKIKHLSPHNHNGLLKRIRIVLSSQVFRWDPVMQGDSSS